MRGNHPPRHCQHTQRLGRQVFVFGLDAGAFGVIERRFAVCGEPSGRTRQQHVGGSLDEHLHRFAGVVEGGHELVRRIEGNFADAWLFVLFVFRVQAALLRQHPERALGGVADQGAVAHLRVGAQRHGQQEGMQPSPLPRPLSRLRERGDGPLQRIALAAHREAAPGKPAGAGGHLVQGQRAGLVGADHCGRTQGFHGGEFFQDRPVLRHAPHADRQRHRHHRRQALRNGSYRQRHGGHRGLRPGQATGEIEDEDQGHYQTGDGGEFLAQSIELDLQRRIRLWGGGDHAGKLAHLGDHAGRRHQHLGAAAGHHGIHVQHVEAIPQRQVGSIERGGGFTHRVGFAG